MNKRYLNVMKYILGIVILFLLFYKIGIKEILDILLKADLIYIFLALVAYIISLILGILNINLFLYAVRKHIKFFELAKCYLLSFSIGMLLPGKIGDFSIVAFLKKYGVEFGEGSAIAIFDKIITLISLVIISIIGILFYFEYMGYWKLVIVVIMAAAGLLFMIFSDFGRGLIKRFLLRRYSEKFRGFSKALNIIAKQYILLSLNFIITLIKWFFSFLMIYYFFLSVGVHVAFIDIVFINSILKLIALITITMSGLGIKEGSAVLLFQNLGVEPVITLGAYTLLLILQYLTAFFVFIISGIYSTTKKS